MNILFSPSFGKKIPITRCCIKDIDQKKYIPATFYEVDCDDMKDIEEISQTSGNWHYKDIMTAIMQDKNIFNRDGLHFLSNKAFYVMQKQDGQIVGLSEVEKIGKQIKLDYFESAPEGKYKYVGQSMLASLGKVLRQEKRKQIYIPNPVKSAREFYIKKCGFKQGGTDTALVIKSRQVEKLRKRLEKETQHPVIEVRI